MNYIHIEKTESGKVKAIAGFGGKEYQAEFEDMSLAAVWAEELAEQEEENGE